MVRCKDDLEDFEVDFEEGEALATKQLGNEFVAAFVLSFLLAFTNLDQLKAKKRCWQIFMAIDGSKMFIAFYCHLTIHKR